MLTLAELLSDLTPTFRVEGAEQITIHTVCVDSRQAAPGSLFVALPGEKTDGHAYVDNAFAAGAVAALVERPVGEWPVIDTLRGAPPTSLKAPVCIVVPKALEALQQAALGRRLARPDLRVVAVTGSVGKTTTKELVAAVLARRFTLLKSQGNQNNEIGLPLTLMALAPQQTHAALEMGMYDLGEIAGLCRIARPQVGIVTNVGPVHLERLGTIERIAQAKAELVEALPADGVAILNGDDERVLAMRKQTAARVATFGRGEGNDVRVGEIVERGLAGSAFPVQVRELRALGVSAAEYRFTLRMLGPHAAMAALPAIALGLVEGLTGDEIAQGLEDYGYGLRLVPKRGPHGSTLLDDCYNASPASDVAALNLLFSVPGRRLAVLGDMLELGSYEEDGHRAVGRRCAAVLDTLATVGERARLIADEARRAGLPAERIHSFPDCAAAIPFLRDVLREGDTLLVKGSRGMAMEAIINALEEREA